MTDNTNNKNDLLPDDVQKLADAHVWQGGDGQSTSMGVRTRVRVENAFIAGYRACQNRTQQNAVDVDAIINELEDEGVVVSSIHDVSVRKVLNKHLSVKCHLKSYSRRQENGQPSEDVVIGLRALKRMIEYRMDERYDKDDYLSDANRIRQALQDRDELIKALESMLKEAWDDKHSYMNEDQFSEYYLEEIKTLKKVKGE